MEQRPSSRCLVLAALALLAGARVVSGSHGSRLRRGRILQPASPAPAPASIENLTDAFPGWHKEYEHGDWPGWKMTNTHKDEYKEFEDTQSDGVRSEAKPSWNARSEANPALSLAQAGEGLSERREEPAAAPAPEEKTLPHRWVPKGIPNIKYDEEQYGSDSWHKEWDNGDWPGWKLTNTHKEQWKQFEDDQSDGVRSDAKDWWTLAQTGSGATGRRLAEVREEPAAAPAPEEKTLPHRWVPKGIPNIKYDEDQYGSDSWHKEWDNGDWPGWKLTNTHKEQWKQFEDDQSDGVRSDAKDWWTLAQTGVLDVGANY